MKNYRKLASLPWIDQSPALIIYLIIYDEMFSFGHLLMEFPCLSKPFAFVPSTFMTGKVFLHSLFKFAFRSFFRAVEKLLNKTLKKIFSLINLIKCFSPSTFLSHNSIITNCCQLIEARMNTKKRTRTQLQLFLHQVFETKQFSYVKSINLVG